MSAFPQPFGPGNNGRSHPTTIVPPSGPAMPIRHRRSTDPKHRGAAGMSDLFAAELAVAVVVVMWLLMYWIYHTKTIIKI